MPLGFSASDQPSGRNGAGGIGGLILAGGRSSRFGSEKAAAVFAGRPMMLHVADRMAGLDAIAVSVRLESWASQCAQEIGAEVVIDDPDAPSGPLAGILAGLQWAEARGFKFLATAPCDAPLLPADVFEILRARIGDAPAAYAATSAGDHPLCALWRVSVRDEVERTLERGHPSVRGFLQRLSAVRVEFAEPSAFANANTPSELIRLEHA